MRDLVADHLERYQRRRIKDRERWRALAEGDLRVYVLPYLGDRVAAELRGADVRAWLAELQTRYAPRTCNLALARLGALYSWAIDQVELLECRNPARGIEALPTERADFFYEADQVEAFLRLDWREKPGCACCLSPLHGRRGRGRLYCGRRCRSADRRWLRRRGVR